MRRLIIAFVVTASVAGLVFSAVGAANNGPDHYLIYKANAREKADIELKDQFIDRPFKVRNLKGLGVPADKTFAGYTFGKQHPEIHLTTYKIKLADSGPKEAKVEKTITNQFGTIDVRVRKPERLLVPASKDLDNPAVPPSSSPVDHFNCYKIKVLGKFTKFQVTVEDQFITPAEVFDVKKPMRLCAPAEKKHDGNTFVVTNEIDHLLCYKVQLKGDDDDDDDGGKTGLFVGDQFDSRQIRSNTANPNELCVPSTKGPFVGGPAGAGDDDD